MYISTKNGKTLFFTPLDRGTGGLDWNVFYPNSIGNTSSTTPSRLYRLKMFLGLK